MLQVSTSENARAILKKELLSQLPAMQNRRSLKNGEASHSGKLFNQTTIDW